ncbi:MAG: hypothetical protein BMS9Abin37_1390 [Acidobacteriota bacterium]|nr:MAG: hypothetical protein BMS9Abin37_1390 [Acidobacteriota bacterium]
MRKLLFLIVMVSLVAMPAAAQFQHLIEVQVKSGHEVAYENYIKKIGEAADKIGSPMSWSTFYVAVGKPGSTYRIGLLFEKWGDRDAWQSGRQVLVDAFGEQEGSEIYSEGGSHVVSSSSRIWEVIDDGTANPQTGTEASPFYEVTIRYLKPEMVSEYRGLLRRFKSAYENAEGKPSVTRWVLRFGTGQNTTFRRTQPFDSWSERDGWNPGELIAAQFGADAPLLIERLTAAVWKTEHFVSAYRPDLSRTATSSTSND